MPDCYNIFNQAGKLSGKSGLYLFCLHNLRENVFVRHQQEFPAFKIDFGT